MQTSHKRKKDFGKSQKLSNITLWNRIVNALSCFIMVSGRKYEFKNKYKFECSWMVVCNSCWLLNPPFDYKRETLRTVLENLKYK